MRLSYLKCRFGAIQLWELLKKNKKQNLIKKKGSGIDKGKNKAAR